MASFLQRLIRKQSLTKTIITDLNKRVLSSPTHLSHPKPDPPASLTTDESYPHPHYPTVYPSFSFGSFLNPVSLTGYIQYVVPEEDVVVDEGDNEGGVWADSVKKKRKKKMNKHKLKKLRKRLRRKT